MNIDELRTVQTKERQKDSLQHLRDAFYEDVADYITDLKAERDRAAAEADDPFSDPDVSRLTDEIETAEEVVEAIYERRVGKVVKLSSFAAAEMPVDEEGLTAQERDLFEDLVGRIGENKTRVLDILAGAGDAGAASSPIPEASSSQDPTSESTSTPPEMPGTDDENPDSSPARTEPAVGAGSDESTPERDSGSDADPTPPPDDQQNSAVDEVVDADPTSDEGETPTPETESTSSPASESNSETAPEAPDSDRTTVRITADVGSVLGVDDREYDLQSEDVVALPADNADALLQRDAAEKLE